VGEEKMKVRTIPFLLDLARTLGESGVEWTCPIQLAEEVEIDICLSRDYRFQIALPFYVRSMFEGKYPCRRFACWVRFETTPRLLEEMLEQIQFLPSANTVGRALGLQPANLPAEIRKERGSDFYNAKTAWCVDKSSYELEQEAWPTGTSLRELCQKAFGFTKAE